MWALETIVKMNEDAHAKEQERNQGRKQDCEKALRRAEDAASEEEK